MQIVSMMDTVITATVVTEHSRMNRPRAPLKVLTYDLPRFDFEEFSIRHSVYFNYFNIPSVHLIFHRFLIPLHFELPPPSVY